MRCERYFSAFGRCAVSDRHVPLTVDEWYVCEEGEDELELSIERRLRKRLDEFN